MKTENKNLSEILKVGNGESFSEKKESVINVHRI